MGYEWLIGMGFSFGIAFVLAYLTEMNMENFLGYMAFSIAFMVWIEFLPLWTLVLSLLVLLFVVLSKFGNRGI